ncbi:MAG TPA: DinB family protein [Vicinamibacterales bacterium]|nr:DinB family protein [Vicinamibacterales bacterium]
MTSLPDDLQKLLDAMNAADDAADALASRVTDEEFFWRPDEKRWSIALCLDHLAVANTVYGQAIREAVDHARARGWTRRDPAAPGFFGRMFVASLEPPPKRRSSAPGKIKPRPVTSRETLLRAYHHAHDEIRRVIRDAATIDVNRATFRNPFIGLVRVRVSTAFNVIAAHDRRHLWQAEQVEKALRSRV